MIAEAIEKIIGLKRPEAIAVGNKNFRIRGEYIPVEESFPPTFAISTLTGILDYINDKRTFSSEDYFIHIVAYSEVRILTYAKGFFENTGVLISAKAITPQHGFGVWQDSEEFIINLSSRFCPSEDRDYLLQTVSGLRAESSQALSDDGISQTTTSRKGVSLVSSSTIKNPVILKPFRTFQEIDQPESRFLFRLRANEGKTPSCAIFECDGGMWRNDAILKIKEFFKGNLADGPASDISIIG